MILRVPGSDNQRARSCQMRNLQHCLFRLEDADNYGDGYPCEKVKNQSFHYYI
jgi:hypothetical protein